MVARTIRENIQLVGAVDWDRRHKISGLRMLPLKNENRVLTSLSDCGIFKLVINN